MTGGSGKPLLFTGDVLGGVIIAGAWLEYLPKMAAIVALIWTLIQIADYFYSSPTPRKLGGWLLRVLHLKNPEK